MPFKNEHSARIINPSKFEENSFRSKKIAPGIRIIVGKLKGQSTTTVQTYRFDSKKFSPEQAKEWIKKHNIKNIDFEESTGEDMQKASDVIEGKIFDFFRKNPHPKDEKFHKFIESLGKEHSKGEEAVYAIIGDLISGGKSKGKLNKVNPEELEMGIKVEFEHTKNKEIAEKIARDHLEEFSNYYSALLKMEKELEKEKPMKKAFIKIYDNIYIDLQKAKRMPIGTISKGRKKIAEGKWVPINENKKKGIMVKKTNKVDEIINLPGNMPIELEVSHFSSDKIEDFDIKMGRKAIYFFERPNSIKRNESFNIDERIKKINDERKSGLSKEEYNEILSDPYYESSMEQYFHPGWYYGNYVNTTSLITSPNKILDLRKWGKNNFNRYEWLVNNIEEYKNLDPEEDESEIDDKISDFYDNPQEEEINEKAKNLGYDVILYDDQSEGNPYTSIAVINDKIIKKDKEMFKAKKMPIGTVSKGKKKVAEGKWVPVKPDGNENKDKKKAKPEKEKPEELSGDKDSKIEKIKVALKKMANILAEAISGKDVNQPTGESVEQVGETLKKKKSPGKTVNPEQKKENDNKTKTKEGVKNEKSKEPKKP